MATLQFITSTRYVISLYSYTLWIIHDSHEKEMDILILLIVSYDSHSDGTIYVSFLMKIYWKNSYLYVNNV